MYLDTDIILALTKKNDWLRPFIRPERIRKPVISSATLIEVELVVSREFGRESVKDFLNKIKKLKIKAAPVTPDIVYKGAELMEGHNINIFDSLHAAYCAINKEKILSSDTIFDSIKEIDRIDPREL